MRNNLIINFKKNPFTRIIIPLAIGITIDILFKMDIHYWLVLSLIVVFIMFLIWTLPLKWKWKFKVVQGMGMLIIIICFGGIVHSLKIKKEEKKNIPPEKIYFLKIIERHKKTKFEKRYIAELYQTEQQNDYISKCYLYSKDSVTPLQVGDIIISTSDLKPLKNISNPGNDGFYNQSIRNGIFFKTVINDIGEYYVIGKENKKTSRLILDHQEWIQKILKNSLKNKDNIGLAEAILIGYREDLDSSLLNTYINTGVVHVIAISGLHVGLIFSLISILINNIFRPTQGKWISLFTALPAIWWFTLVTGSSPSVIRSAMMMTFVLIGNASEKKTSGLNILFASAFIQVIYNPDIITDLGFQLSYSAVCSIMVFNPIISKIFSVKNKILKACWDMISVTLSAQLLTSPISIYQFHQFPLLFLITNIVAIPLSSIILIVEILLCLTSLIGLKTNIFSTSVDLFIEMMNGYIRKIEKVPFAMINEIHIGVPTLLMLYLLCGIFYLIMKNRNPKNILKLVIAYTLTAIIYNTHKIITSLEKRIAILNLYGETCILIQDGQFALMITSEQLLDNKHIISILKNQLKNTYWIEKIEYRSLPQIPAIISIDNGSFLTNSSKDKSKTILVMGNPKIQLNECSTPADSSCLFVADASNKLWKIQQWEKEADRLLLRFHATNEMGPVILESP